MQVAVMLVLSTLTAAADANGPAYWIEALPRALVRGGQNAPEPDCVDAELSLENFSGQLDDWY